MILYRLCLHLGYSHPDYLVSGLTASQLNGWRAYSAIEPFGEYRNELRHGQQMQLLDAAHFKRDKPKKVSDFMNFLNIPEPESLNDDEYYDQLDKEIFGE